jgi:putative ABC transport system permease protein
MRKLGQLGLRAVPSAWLPQTARPLTAVQINAAPQAALAAGATIETKSQAPSLSELRNWATAAGILLALGVLAMTVGLIRSETAGDLRTLTTAGASRRTRRTLTGATAGGWLLAGREPSAFADSRSNDRGHAETTSVRCLPQWRCCAIGLNRRH